jgi:hypothetical protein
MGSKLENFVFICFLLEMQKRMISLKYGKIHYKTFEFRGEVHHYALAIPL